MAVKNWAALAKKAILACAKQKLGQEYKDRLKREIKEITKQGANNYWVRLYNSGQKFEENKNGLVFPYLLGVTNVDPVEAELDHITRLDPEFPDIDLDLLTVARDPIKKYAEETYGSEHVCNVGLWLTYKTRLAIQDAATVLGHNRHDAMAMSKDLPAEFDDMDHKDAYEEFEEYKKYSDEYPEVVELASKMRGKIKSQGKHAGGLIISSVPIRDFVPLTYIGVKGNKQWTSAWTEGMAASQLSKFGLVKFDLLGLLNLAYIYDCKQLVKKTQGIDIDFEEIHPGEDKAGWMTYPNGKKKKIRLNDPAALKRANEVKLESIFQFDTDLQKSILEKGGVKSFMDLVIYNSLGRPGPLPMVDVYIGNRDGKNNWKDNLHPKMLDILGKTAGVLCLDSETLIRTASGQDKFIKDLSVGEIIMSYDVENRSITPCQVLKVGQTRIGSGLRITTDDHREIITTDDHEFVCFDGSLKKANELTSNDLIPVPVKHQWQWNNESFDKIGLKGNDEEWAYLLGYIVGDGLLTGSSPTICCGNIKGYADKLNNWLIETFNFKTTIYWHCRSWYIRIVDPEPITITPDFDLPPYDNTKEWWQHAYDNLPTSVIKEKLKRSNWWVYHKLNKHNIILKNHRRIVDRNRFKLVIERHGLNCNVYNKRIPNWIFNSNIKIASQFLAGLLDSDGCVSSQNKTNLLSLISCNKKLLNDVSKLLDILEINHNFQKDRVFIWGQVNFNKLVLPLSRKKVNWNGLCSAFSGDNLGWVPRSAVLKKAKEFGISKRALDKNGILYRGHWKSKAKFCRSSTARKVGISLGQVRFQKVKSVEEVDDRIYYGIEVDEHHTLIGNNIVVHNCFQEQLLRIWVEVCGFTMPEASILQKAVKKKHREILDENGPRVIEGAAVLIGQKDAEDLWDKMKSFGRYCFNMSHAIGYTLIAYRCLWLKTHFPSEWWAAVLSKCPNPKTLQFLGAARSEGIDFGSINVNCPTAEFSVADGKVIPGILSVKGVGSKFGKILVNEIKNGEFATLDEFVKRCGRHKTAIERLVKLGGFDSFYPNRKALWMWYYYKYCSGTDVTRMRRLMSYCYAWSADEIDAERARQTDEYMRVYPTRKTAPQKISKWEPSTPTSNPRKFNSKLELSQEQIRLANRLDLEFEQVAQLFPKDFTLSEILDFEKEFLGYYWHSPVDVFIHDENTKIENAKKTGIIECVIEEVQRKKGARGEYLVLNVNDGVSTARVNVWSSEMDVNDEEVFEAGVGIRTNVRWQEKWRSFSVKRHSLIMPLMLKEEE